MLSMDVLNAIGFGVLACSNCVLFGLHLGTRNQVKELAQLVRDIAANCAACPKVFPEGFEGVKK